MNRIVTTASGFLLATLLVFATGAHAAWEPIVPGLDYREFRYESPQNDIFVTRMSRTATDLIVDGSLANGKISQPNVGYNAEIIPAQAERYDGAFGFWGRETARYRYRVLAAINGCGFSLANGYPDSAMAMNGALIKQTFGSSSATMGAMGFAYKIGSSAPTPGTPYMAGELSLPADLNKNCLSFSDGTSMRFHKINDQPAANQIILYTHHYGARTPSATDVTEIVVRLSDSQPLRIIPWSNFTPGEAIEIRTNSSGQTPIPFDCVVVVASGTARATLEAKVPTVGTAVRFSLETRDTSGLDWTNMYCAIGPMWGVILRNGEKPDTTSDGYHTAVHPRTGVAFGPDFIYFLVVDGRSGRSTGMTLNAMADFCKDVLGATDAVNNDGGGSSLLWADGEVKNAPCDGTNRPVANGLMMIQLLPKEVSEAYDPDDEIAIDTGGYFVPLMTGPGTHFHSVRFLTDGTVVTVLDHPLNGLRAQDFEGNENYWWHVVTTDGATGWIGDAMLDPPPGVVILDNPVASFTGSWITATTAGDKFGEDYRFANSGSGATATYNANLAIAGLYDVSTWYPAGTNRANNAPYTIHHVGGSTTVLVNQRTGGGQWNSLGSYQFAQGGGQVVIGTVGATEHVVMADAVKFTLLPDPPPTPTPEPTPPPPLPATASDVWMTLGHENN